MVGNDRRTHIMIIISHHPECIVAEADEALRTKEHL
jgi:hypothetical protein